MKTVLTKRKNGVAHIVARFPSYTRGASALHDAQQRDPESDPRLYSAPEASRMGLPLAMCVGGLQPGGRYGPYPCDCTFR